MLEWFTLILACQLAGEFAAAATGLPLPGPVIGMVLLFLLLAIIGRVPEELASAGNALLSNLSLLFVPAGVGVMAHFALLEDDWPALGAAVVGSTLLTIAVTALAYVWLRRLSRPRHGGKGGEA